MNSSKKINNKRRRIDIKPDLEEFNGVKEEFLRVGKEFQAVYPEFQAENERETERLQENAVKVWSPTDTIEDEDLEKHIDFTRS
ncbi:hypothetical protein WA026_019979 [Henosepilachna vigintioctopunctata]|uniref:ELM2 domain-containing protein n=1 Tax=Henosepilachna vigintioctopunctata TaxID=420089 RepID=A0AAW1V599_9CUCU